MAIPNDEGPFLDGVFSRQIGPPLVLPAKPIDDHAIFPESQLSAMAAQGYTQNSGSDWLGYVYRNTNGNVPAIN